MTNPMPNVIPNAIHSARPMQSSNTQPVLEARGLRRVYQDAGREVCPIDGLDFSVSLGETIAVVGPSGSGKTTLLQLLGGVDEPTSGSLYVAGRPMHGIGDAERTALRNQSIGFVYQFHHLLPEFSALDNVAMPLRIAREPKAQAREAAQAMLEAVGLADRAHHLPSQLSGGERQRVAIARALVTKPALVLADEPTGNLDRDTAELVFALLVERVKQSQSALVVVTHDPSLAERCDRVVALRKAALR